MKNVLNNKTASRKTHKSKVAGVSKATKYTGRSDSDSLYKIVVFIQEQKKRQQSIEAKEIGNSSISYSETIIRGKDTKQSQGKILFNLNEEYLHTKSARTYELLNQNYDLVNASDVFDFVSKEAKLVGFLVKAKKRIASFFPNTRLQLEHIVDSEIPTWEKLWIKIPVQNSSDGNYEKLNESLKKIDELREQWWLDIPFDIRRLVSMELDF